MKSSATDAATMEKIQALVGAPKVLVLITEQDVQNWKRELAQTHVKIFQLQTDQHILQYKLDHPEQFMEETPTHSQAEAIAEEDDQLERELSAGEFTE